MDNIIDIQNLGKKYVISHEGKTAYNYTALRDVMAENLKKTWKRISRREKNAEIAKKKEAFWALKNISLKISPGERLGIIGRNGAGKTTLLKILTRITAPTEGYARIEGRVSSLLEVGTGFHPELTGRENIYLNGAILGMKKFEIDKKFDEIVDFSGIEKFLDTPVKRYSSGMQVRLAFAVAAHLEPEILLIDEVLAVGDVEFQKKCMGKMEEVSRNQGRTILFVSHNMAAVRNLCSRTILLESGQIAKDGTPSDVAEAYEKQALSAFGEFSPARERKPEQVKNKGFYASGVKIYNEKGEPANLFRYNEKFHLIVRMEGKCPEDCYHLVFRIYNEMGQMLFSAASAELHNAYFGKNTKNIKITVGPLLFTAGTYRVELVVRTGKIQGEERTEADIWQDAVGFKVSECMPFATNFNMKFPRDGLCIVQNFFEAI